MIKVKYRKSYYKTNLKTKINIEFLKTVLLFNRLKRFIKRIFLYNIPNIITIIFIFIILSVIIYLGIRLNEYVNFLVGLWDLKDILITNVILILFVTTYNSEKLRHDSLKLQFGIYYSLMVEAEYYILDLLKILDYSFTNSIYIDEENYDIFHSQIKNLPNNIKLTYSNKKLQNILLYMNKKFVKKLNFLLKNAENFIGVNPEMIYDVIFENLDEEIHDLENMNINNINSQFLKKYILSISGTLYLLIANYRRPWRWDIGIDKKIRKLLVKNGTFCKGNFDCLKYYEKPFIEKKVTKINN